ncbi:hypothetical protein [Pseudaestuariivita sp.]|uniref:hypothetical protein n=1 Tax=Pseudaestuariivita sp. TaxID=2211669 RepID=UPI0040582D2F
MMTRLAPLLLALLPTNALADPPAIEKVEARPGGMGWTFTVTLSHPDTGWDHYADGWEVMLEDGTSLGIRELLHPHVHEQPFTRSLSGVTVPDGVRTVYVRARDNVDGWAPGRTKVTLTLGE